MSLEKPDMILQSITLYQMDKIITVHTMERQDRQPADLLKKKRTEIVIKLKVSKLL